MADHTLIRLRTRLAARLLCAGFAVGLAPAAFGQSADDTGYDRYRNQTGEGSSLVGRAWQDVRKWAGDRGTSFTKSFGDGGKADPSLMPLSPAILPEYANGNRAPAVPSQPPSGPQPFAFRTPQAQPQTPPPPGGGLPFAYGPPQRTPQTPPPLARHPQSPFAFGGGPVMAGPQGTGAPPAHLAGKPAYNWYGYGSAPSAESPQASSNWIQQTGATAGAFPNTAGRPPLVPPPSPPGFVGGPKAVSVIPTLPTIAPPAPPTVEPPPAAAEPKTIPTIRPLATAPEQDQPTPKESPAPVPAPKSDEPEWQPAPRRPLIEQMSGKAENGRIVPAIANETADAEPLWQTAPPQKVVAPAAPVVKTMERAPALLPVPIPAAPNEVPVIEPVSNPVPPVVMTGTPVPVAPAPVVASTPERVPTTVPVPTQMQTPAPDPIPVPSPIPAPSTPVMAATPTPPAAAISSNWQSTSGYQAPSKPKSVATHTNPAVRTTVAANAPQAFTANPKSGWKTNRTTPPTSPVPATMASGLVAPPPDAPETRVIPVTSSREVLDLERQIRAATVRTATILEVSEIAPQKYVVKLVSKSEAAARDAAAAISAIPALKPFAIDFEVRLAGQ